MSFRRLHVPIVIILTSMICAACTNEVKTSTISHPPFDTGQGRESSPTVLPSLISTPTTNITQTPTPLVSGLIIPTPNNPELALPNLILNFGPDTLPWFNCGPIKYPGQIWYAQYPFEKANIVLSDSTNGYYAPTSSPNGEWVAYINIAILKPEETLIHGNLERKYSNSDAIWIMHPDGSNKKQISSKLTRYEVDSGQRCEPAAGIDSIVGWSFDSQWLVYHYRSTISDILSNYNIINLNTEKITTISGQYSFPRWAPKDNKIALVDNDNGSIEILNVDQANTSNYRLSIPYPSNLPLGFRFTSLQWSSDQTKLYLLGKEKPYVSYNALWMLDILQNDWKKIAILDSNEATNLIIYENEALVCLDNQNIEIRDLEAGGLIGSIKNSKQADCGSLHLFRDNLSNNYLSFKKYSDSYGVTIFSMGDYSSDPKTITLEQKLNFPTEMRIVSFYWQCTGNNPC